MKPLLQEALSLYLKHNFTQMNYSKGTKKNKMCYYKSIIKFLESTGQAQITVDQVRHRLMMEMYDYLRASGNSMTNCARTVDLCKAAMSYAEEIELVDCSKIATVKPKRDKVKQVIYCEKNELQRLCDLSTGINRLERCKDLYTVICCTGMSWGDLKTYKIVTRDGELWLENRRNKTGSPYWVPLNRISTGAQFLRLYNKYNGKLPRPRLHDFNKALRELCQLLNIDKHLTSHTGRKTFATTMDMAGVKHEDIAYMMGITTAVLTKHYIYRSVHRLAESMPRHSMLEVA